MEVPIIGRLTISDYQALIIGLMFLFFEGLLRFVTFCLPDERTQPIKHLQHAENFRELVNFWDYPVEEHIVKTRDNYILGIQRIPRGKMIPDNDDDDKENNHLSTKPVHRVRHDSENNSLNNKNRSEEDYDWRYAHNSESIEFVFRRCGISLSTIRHPFENEIFPNINDSLGSSSLLRSSSINSRSTTRRNTEYIKPVVLLYHGLMTNSEIWVCNYEYENRLAYLLADAGYDVWFGNSRGNKYSMKHTKYDPSEKKFWEYSMDDLAIYDVPSTIEYILETTGAPSLTYIGFSQGTAQCFAALSINPKINKKINLFIALAPATSPRGLSNSMFNALIKSSPNVFYLFFGKKEMLSMTLFWQKVLSPPIFTKIIDFALKFLFGWTCENISETQKAIGYYHLYSCTSVKCIVHWFQIIKSRTFQMYDELPPFSLTAALGHSCQRFPTQQITTPIAVFYGGKDSLGDMSMLLKQIPTPVLVREIVDYEHLDFIWASNVGIQVYPELFDLLRQYNVYHDHYFGDVLSVGGSDNNVNEIEEREDQSINDTSSDEIQQIQPQPLEDSEIYEIDRSQYLVDGSQYLVDRSQYLVHEEDDVE
ncbi:5148_t:CDS:2 [Diversispora eburnea]|uniref:5148_t:CDS:1 n=1 Tax=Diversispora eburnea TaxID=1213867 RepID=A0A9N9CJR6_9GLOM|nr:5148_t:CDS:2 [Diversispora eburnea]